MRSLSEATASVGAEQHVARVDVRAHVVVPGGLEHVAQVGHGHGALPAHVDAPQQGHEATTLLPGDVTTPAAGPPVRPGRPGVGGNRPDRGGEAELLTTELVADAIVHAGCKSRLFIRAAKGIVRVEVSDPDDRQPTLAALDVESLRSGTPGHRQRPRLRLRGVEPTTGSGKTVWFELSPLSHHGLA